MSILAEILLGKRPQTVTDEVQKFRERYATAEVAEKHLKRLLQQREPSFRERRDRPTGKEQ